MFNPEPASIREGRPFLYDARRSSSHSSGFDAGRQFPKVPHLRNQKQKVGMFGVAFTSERVPGDEFLGDQVRGFGFNSDGTIPTLFRFGSDFDLSLLNPVGIPHTPEGVTAKKNKEAPLPSVSDCVPPRSLGRPVGATARPMKPGCHAPRCGTASGFLSSFREAN